MNGRHTVRRLVVSFSLVLCAVSFSAEGAERELWVEAESFDSLGGWLIDQQSMGQMGSAYIMAHGIGKPVDDAERAVAISADGTWHVWVRTRDWTAPWKRGTPGGTFKLIVSGKTLPEAPGEALGTNGADWAWQKAGTVNLTKGRNEMALRDLTGFNGRCDAIYFTLDPKAQPPDEEEALDQFRKRPPKSNSKTIPKSTTWQLPEAVSPGCAPRWPRREPARRSC